MPFVFGGQYVAGTAREITTPPPHEPATHAKFLAMPRGRHRHSQPLHRLLPPLSVAGFAAVLAVASLFAGDTGLLRALTVVAALTAVTGATLARAWDRSAGRRVAELITLRTRDEWRTDERMAELEMDLEEFREIRGRLEKKLRGKRSELARLRTEHAALLRRYATAESERAGMIEARRHRVGGAAGRPLALGTGTSPVGPAAYLKAAEALRNLPRNAAKQQAQQTVREARRRDAAGPEEPQGKHASASPSLCPLSRRRCCRTPSRPAAARTRRTGRSADSTSSARRRRRAPRKRIPPPRRAKTRTTSGPPPRSSTSRPTTRPNNWTSPNSAPRPRAWHGPPAHPLPRPASRMRVR